MDLAQVANALRRIEPQINAMMERRAQGEQEGLQARAIRDASEMQITNQQALKTLVDAGKLPEYENPWYRVQLRQEVAKSEVSTARSAVWDEYLQSPERHSENIQDVQKFFGDRFAKLTEGRDAWEMQVIAPAIRQMQDSFLQAHVNQKDDERQMEMELGTKRSLTEVFNGLSTQDIENLQSEDPARRQAAQQKQAAVQNRLAAVLTEKGRVINRAKLEAWTVDAAINATAAGKPGLGRALLAGLPSFDGKSDLGSAYSGQLERADEHAMDQVVHRMERQDRMEAFADKKEIEASEKTLFAEFDRVVAQDPNARASDVIAGMQVPMSSLSPRVRLRVEQLKEYMVAHQDRVAKDKNLASLDRMIEEYFGKKISGVATDQDHASLIVATAAMGAPERLPYIEQGLASLKRDKDVESDPALVDELRTKWAKGDLTLTDAIEAYPKLSFRDRDEYTLRAKQLSAEKHTDQTDQIGLGNMKLTAALEAKYIHADDADEETKLKLQNQMRIDGRSAQAELADGMIQIQKNKDLSPIEKDNQREQLVNGLIKKYTGHASYDAFLQSEEKLKQKKEEAAKASVSKPAQPLDKEVFLSNDHPDKIFDGISREQTSIAKWAMLSAKPTKSKSDPDLPGQYVLNWASDHGGTPLQKQTAFWMSGNSGLTRDDKPGRVSDLGWAEVPSLKVYYSQQEIKLRDSVFARALPDAQAKAELALQNWKQTTTDLASRSKSGTPFITYNEKLSLLNDTNTAREYVHYRKVFGYKPEEVEKLGSDGWKSYRMFMNEVDLEQNGPKAVQLLKIPPSRWQEFRSAQKELILRDVNEVDKSAGM